MSKLKNSWISQEHQYKIRINDPFLPISAPRILWITQSVITLSHYSIWISSWTVATTLNTRWEICWKNGSKYRERWGKNRNKLIWKKIVWTLRDGDNDLLYYQLIKKSHLENTDLFNRETIDSTWNAPKIAMHISIKP